MPAVINKEKSGDTIIDRLLAPMDVAYTDAMAADRMRKLSVLYGAANKDAGLAGLVCEMTKRSYWSYLALAVWTKDPKSMDAVVKPFSPLRVYKDLSDWADAKNPNGTWARPVLVIDKTRQLMLSWWCVVRLNWLGERKPFAEIPVVSKREIDAVRVLDRIPIVHRYYPKFYREQMGLMDMRKDSFTRSRINYPNDAYIEALPEDGEKVRSMVVSGGWFCDEAAFQPHFADNYGSIRGGAPDPRVQGLVVSTPNPGEFEELIHDKSNRVRGTRTIERARTMEATYEGQKIFDYEFWLNNGNQVHCASITFLSDPARRAPDWWREAKRGMPMHKLKREQLLCYDALGGHPVFDMLDRKAHVMAGQPKIVRIPKTKEGYTYGIEIPGYGTPTTRFEGRLKDRKAFEVLEPIITPVTLIRAIDHGTHGYFACTWHAIMMDDTRDWIIYRSYKKSGWGVTANARAVAELSEGEEYRWDVIDAMDRTPEGTGQVYEMYQAYKHHDGTRPLFRVEPVRKGAGSRQEGVEAIQAMLLSTLAVNAPDAPYWDESGYDADHVVSLREHSSIYLAPSCTDVFDELDMARYDERKGPDAALMNRPETTVDMQDDEIDTIRYAIRAGGHLMRSRRDA